jgi:thioesterase domain-containing protein
MFNREESPLHAVRAASVELHADGDSGVTVIRGTGTQRPLFLIHDIYGQIPAGAALLQNIDVDMPVFGLLGVMPHEKLPRTIEAFARRCVLLLRALQPEGPYRLAGLSFGGVLAYEIAGQLIGEDQEVEFLGLIDSICPLPLGTPSPITRVPSLEEQLLSCCVQNEITRDSSAAALAALESTPGLDFEHMLRHCHSARILPEYLTGQSTEQTRHHLARLSAHKYALQHYAVYPLPIPVHVFTVAQDSDLPSGWGAVLPWNRLRSIRVAGVPAPTPSSVYMAAIGRALGNSIREASSGSSPRVTLLETSYCPHLSIQPGRHGRAPIFCVPGAGNSVTGFNAWARAVGQEWPVHGLQPRGVAADMVPHSSVQSAARQYLDAINKAHPHGPLHLVGHSFGGWIVFELARLLGARGRAIASLTVIDGDAPNTEAPLLGEEYTAIEVLVNFVDLIEIAAGRSLDITPADLATRNDAGRLQLLHQAMVRVGMLPMRTKPGMLVGVLRTFGAALRTTYRPSSSYPGPLRLVTVRDTRKEASADERRRETQVKEWQRWAPQLSCWYGPGNHMTVLDDPHVAMVADWWRSISSCCGSRT